MNHYNGRWNHVHQLWKNALSQEIFPQFDRWLSNEFAKNSKYGSKDRRWYSDILFASVRHGYFALLCTHIYPRPFTDQLVEEFKNKFKTPEDIFAGFKAANPEDFFDWVSLRYDSHDNRNSISEDKKNYFKSLVAHLNDNLMFHSVPIWFLDYYNGRLNQSNFNKQQMQLFLNNLDSRPPLWVRVNHLDRKNEVIQELKKENYSVEDFHATIKITGAKGVFSLNSYRNGLFEIQDLASQKIGLHVKAEPKQYVWDCCAGGGGKTLQIASFLKNKGVIYASDIREYKLEEVKKRAKRSGFFNIRCLTWNGESLPQFQKEVQIKGGFDWVLVDAPCSSTGTWRRNPDAKYRVHTENINNLCKLQLSILSKASEAVLAGGHIVYSTCSWIVEENEGVVAQFLQNHPEFKLVEQNLLGSPFENADTMFAAVIKKHN
ncbi:MAG: RsmB/NOP family class I SAM-dependent RNA methyltransferase [Bdellovibrionota bacterium]